MEQNGQQVEQGGITQTPPTMVEENNTPAISTENVTDVINESAGAPVTSDKLDGDTLPPEGESTDAKEVLTLQTQDEAETLKAKLAEYELKEQEALELRNRLGIKDTNTEAIHLDTVEATIQNQAQQQWITLCNKFGVDFSPENVDSSSKALLEKDPKAYYEFKAEGENLYRDVQFKREQIQTTRTNHEINSFVQENQPLIENSPVVKMLVSDYIQNNGMNMVNPKQELGNLLEAIKLVYAEAMQVGQLTAQSNQLTSDKSGISGGVATATTPSYPLNDGTKVFTRDEIKSMDTATFNKYEKEIERQYLNGLIK